jgi:hypothetical protein
VTKLKEQYEGDVLVSASATLADSRKVGPDVLLLTYRPAR